MHHTIDIEHLSYTFPDGTQALRDVNLMIGPDERVALVGPNGAGKSTLMLHLNGLIMPTSGLVKVGGHPVTKENLAHVRADVGLVFQNPDDQLFNLKVYDDVAFGPMQMGLPEAEVRDRVMAALAAVGMSEYSHRMPTHLSIGEKKRVAIATVLSMDPEILVFDEPTSGLDPRARRQFIELLREMDRTMLIATHDMYFVAEFFPRTIILDGGQIAADGPTAGILGDETLLRAHGLEMS